MNMGTTIRQNWFYALLPVWALAAWSFRAAYPWTEDPKLGEVITLFDWCLFVPLTFVLCYRSRPRKAVILRGLALATGGVWLAGKIVPPAAQALLLDLGGVRSAGLAILLVFELAAAAALLRMLFGATPEPRALEEQGVPPFVAKLMLAEARFWRWVWTKLVGK